MFETLQAPESKRFLLIASKPAANGGLHLGHLGGPYLRMDALRRHLQRSGAAAHVVFGSDAHDSFVTTMAKRLDLHPTEFADRCHTRIMADLSALHIHVDAVINPARSPGMEQHLSAYRTLMDSLWRASQVEPVTEKLWYAPASDHYALGSRLSGKCPHCRDEAIGFFCESCGAHIQPPEMLDATPTQHEGWTWTRGEAVSLYYRIRDVDRLLAQLRATGTPERFLAIVERQLERSSPRVRLANPRSADDWGLYWSPPDGEGAYTLSLVGLLFAYCLLCGDAYQKVTGDPVNPFHAGSSVTTVNLFGLDNVTSHMIFIQALALSHESFKPFDHFAVNYFRNLAGEKFSTSRGHAIWGSDIVRKTPVPADVIRYYLTARDATNERSDFDIDDFVHFVNQDWLGEIQPWLNTRVEALRAFSPTDPPAALLERLGTSLRRQQAAFAFSDFQPRDVAATIRDWASAFPIEAPESPYWQLKGFALLAYPVLPGMAQRLWTWLHGEGEPRLASFGQAARPRGSLRLDAFDPIDRATIAPCLPGTLA